jgi:hypothetical protein
MGTRRGQKQAHTKDIDKLSSWQKLFLKFKGTPSLEEHEISVSVLITIELALSGRIGII